MLELDNIRLGLGATSVRLNLIARSGEWIAVVGPSGAGKTTLINLISGFLAPDSGSLRFEGQDLLPLPPADRPITSLFQEHNLFHHMTAADNVGLGLDPGLRLSAKQNSKVADALARVGLADRRNDLPGDLSGGERQRVALARALVRNRPVLLLDEPLSQLDPALRFETLRLISDLHNDRQLTILMVLHTPWEAVAFVDRYLFIDKGETSAEFTPDEFRRRKLPEAVLAYLGEGR